MWKFWIQEINCFGKMAEFVNFEAVEDNFGHVINVDEDEEVYKSVSDGDFIDDENDFNENVEAIMFL